MKFILRIILLVSTISFIVEREPLCSQVPGQAVFRDNKLNIPTQRGMVDIQAYTDDVISIEYKTVSSESVNSMATISNPQKGKVNFQDRNGSYIFSTASIKLVVNKQDQTIEIIQKDQVMTRIAAKAGEGGSVLDFSLSRDEAIYGGGSKAIEINRRGVILENYNQAHYGYSYGQTNLNISIPLLLSSRGYGLYFEDPARSIFDIGKTDNDCLIYKTGSTNVRFFYIAGGSQDAILNSYTQLTGKQPLPARWALGYIQSRYGYHSERELIDVIDRTIAAGIPIDATVLDLYWYKDAYLMGNHSWNKDSFPDAKLMIQSLKTKGIKLIPISETYITLNSENFNYVRENQLLTSGIDGKPYLFNHFWAGKAGLLDIFNPKAQQFYWNLYKERFDEGIAGWWFDLGEPEMTSDSLMFCVGKENDVHNLYSLVWAKTAFEGLRNDFPQVRPFTLIRSGFAGMQRYSVFPWSGDISRSFNGLKAQIPIMLGMGLSGVGYIHSDAGGFAGGRNMDTELYSRWLEFAAFTPVMRTHGAGTPPEPIFWDGQTRERVARYIKLRYQFLPYNYTLSYLNSTTGRPLMLPLNYFEIENERLKNINDEYLWGEHVLVAPVINKGDTVKRVLFPKGEWIGYHDGKLYSDSAQVSAPIDILPLFVRAGSVIPMSVPIQNTDQFSPDKLELHYFPQARGVVRSQWFNDDGRDPASLHEKKYDKVTIITQKSRDGYKIILEPEVIHYSMPENLVLVVHGVRDFGNVNISGGIPFTIENSFNGIDSKLLIPWTGKKIEVSFGGRKP